MDRRIERNGKMIKKNWKILLATSLVVLLPIAAGLILWEQLPDMMPTHWDITGEVDDMSSKPAAVFGPTLVLLAVHWLCLLVTFVDPKKKNHGRKILYLVTWLIPVLSVLLNTLMYITAMDNDVRIELVMPVFLGLVLAIIGNYLPKCKQNYTIGIKLPWTLHSEENWNRTHRFAGRIWLGGGLVIMLTGLVGGFWIFVAAIFLMVLAPMIFSYVLHRKGI